MGSFRAEDLRSVCRPQAGARPITITATPGRGVLCSTANADVRRAGRPFAIDGNLLQLPELSSYQQDRDSMVPELVSNPEPKRILVVEDEVLTRCLISDDLREVGFVVIVKLLSDARISVDVVLADVDAPEGSGFALAGWIRANHPSIDVILAGTVAKATEEAGNLCQEGPTASKPYDHQLLLDHIRRSHAARDRNR